MTSVDWLDEREETAWRALQFMQMRLNARLAHDLAAESGLSYPDYLLLVALTDRADGRMRAFELGEQLGWEQSRVSHHIARMVDRGLVTREKCASDRRGAYIAVTAGGRDAIEQAAPGHVATVRRAFLDHLTPNELDVIGAAASRVLQALDAPGESRSVLQPAVASAAHRRSAARTTSSGREHGAHETRPPKGAPT